MHKNIKYVLKTQLFDHWAIRFQTQSEIKSIVGIKEDSDTKPFSIRSMKDENVFMYLFNNMLASGYWFLIYILQ